MMMTAADYRESLRAYRPRVFLNGERVESVADEARLIRGSTPSASLTTSPTMPTTAR